MQNLFAKSAFTNALGCPNSLECRRSVLMNNLFEMEKMNGVEDSLCFNLQSAYTRLERLDNILVVIFSRILTIASFTIEGQ